MDSDWINLYVLLIENDLIGFFRNDKLISVVSILFLYASSPAYQSFNECQHHYSSILSQANFFVENEEIQGSWDLMFLNWLKRRQSDLL